MGDAIHDVPYIADPVEVGSGGFATVYRAMDLQAGRLVAVKLLSVRSDDVTLKHFDRERESLARLSTHPNVVTLHRTGVTTDGIPYLVMEFASGGTLADRLENDGPLPWGDAVEWILPVCDALEHAHRRGVRHRDIKPQNILISDHGEPLLSDFGIAGMSAGPDTITDKVRLSLSHASPEQVDGRELDDSTDVYSLGATLYTLISGTPPFADVDGAGFLNTAKRVIEEQPPALDGSVPADIADAIAAAMAKNPARRPTIGQFGHALEREASLVAPPPGDALPAVTREILRPGPAATAVLPTAVVPSTAASPGAGEAESDDDDHQGLLAAAMASRSVRWASLIGVALLVVSGTLMAAWTGRGDDAIADGVGAGGKEIASSSDQPTATGQPASPSTFRPDRDGDGAADADDNCPDVANDDQANVDGDPLGDACDPDDDNDGVPDGRDNCAVAVNGDQEDVDDDQLGDACDDFPDRDRDGLIDTDDPCIEQPTDPDTDGDGIPDKCDASPRGMVVVAASARIDRVTIVNQAYGDGEADMFGDLTLAGSKFDLPEIADTRDIRPGNWLTDQVPIEPGVPLVRLRIWIRDEDDCFFCRDGLVDITPEAGSNALHLVIDTSTGAVDLASESWNRLETVATLSGADDGNLSGTITQSGDDDEVHRALIDVSVTLVREPAP